MQEQRELEIKIDQLQSKAEILARSRYSENLMFQFYFVFCSYLQKMCGSGKHMEPARWWHSDFEFFHQRG